MNIPTIIISINIIFLLQYCNPSKQIASDICISTILEQKNLEIEVNEIWQYQFQEQLVYYITMNGADQYNKLLNSQCELLCHPDGGITGRGDGRCPEFFDERTDGKLLWPEK